MQEDYVKDGEFLPAVENDFLRSIAAPIEVNTSTEAADVVKTTQGIRLKILAERLKKGVSEDAKELGLDLQLLRDLDTAALTTRKIDVEERATDAAEQTSNQTNALLKMLDGKNPFAVDLTTGQLRSDLTGRARSADLPEVVPVKGHTHQGTENLNYADFVDDPDNDDNDIIEDEED